VTLRSVFGPWPPHCWRFDTVALQPVDVSPTSNDLFGKYDGLGKKSLDVNFLSCLWVFGSHRPTRHIWNSHLIRIDNHWTRHNFQFRNYFVLQVMNIDQLMPYFYAFLVTCVLLDSVKVATGQYYFLVA
jgi:hypothetical protein